MTEFSESIMINREPDVVWALVGEPSRIDDWLPFIETAEVNGDARHCTAANGAELVERILDVNRAGRSYQYTIEASPMPIESLLATVAVSPAGGSASLVTWHTDVEPAELVEVFAPIYREGLESLREKLEVGG